MSVLRNKKNYYTIDLKTLSEVRYLSDNYRSSGSSVGFKRWPTDLAVPGSSPTGGGNRFNCERSSIGYSLSLSNSHHPDMTNILLKRM